MSEPQANPIQTTNFVAGPARTPGAIQRQDSALERLLAEQAAATEAAAGVHDISSLEHNQPWIHTLTLIEKAQQQLDGLLQRFTHDVELADLHIVQTGAQITSLNDGQILGRSIVDVLRGHAPAGAIGTRALDRTPPSSTHDSRPYRNLAAITLTPDQHTAARRLALALLIALGAFDALIVYLAVSWLGGGPLELVGFTATLTAMQIILSHRVGIALKEGRAYNTPRYWLIPAVLTFIYLLGPGALVTMLRVAEVNAPVATGYGEASQSALSQVGIGPTLLTVMLGLFLVTLYALSVWVSYNAHNHAIDQWMDWRATYGCTDPEQLNAQIEALQGDQRLLARQRDHGLPDVYRHEGHIVSALAAQLLTIFAATLTRVLANPEATTVIEARTASDLTYLHDHLTDKLQTYLDTIDQSAPSGQTPDGTVMTVQPNPGERDDLAA